MSERVLIIGGSGFLGTALRTALGTDSRFSVTYTRSSGSQDSGHVILDILQGSVMERIQGFDVVINLTGQVSEPMSTCIKLNTIGISHLLSALNDRQRFIQISTTLVYGTGSAPHIQPESLYAAAKASADHALLACLPPDRLSIVRLSNLYGRGQNKGLPWFVLDHIKRNVPIVIADNDGHLRRSFLHVEDAANIVTDILRSHQTGIIDVPGPESLSIREFISLCEKIHGRKVPVQYADTPSPQFSEVCATLPNTSIIRHSVAEYLRERLA